MERKKSLTAADLQKFDKDYSEKSLFKKLGKFAKRAGRKTVYYVLVLYFTLTDPKTPAKYKATIAGALGYFILPLDFLPDFIPGAGMVDDWGAVVAAVAYVATAITPDIKARAKAKLSEWFGSYEVSDLGDLA
ncbi:MAG: DUF1232 domain-containing protein [Bacteroidales bacterium]|nr:DUF1232 domain-containing protein [Bacteroidales bacterium]